MSEVGKEKVYIWTISSRFINQYKETVFVQKQQVLTKILVLLLDFKVCYLLKRIQTSFTQCLSCILHQWLTLWFNSWGLCSRCAWWVFSHCSSFLPQSKDVC